MSRTPSGVEVGLGCIGVLMAVVLGPIITGLVLSVLWGWFMVPTFGLPALSIIQALGLALLTSFLIRRDRLIPKQEDKSFTAAVGGLLGETLIAPFIVLLVGWVYTLFM